MNSDSLRLAAGYFMYFGAVGIFAPFWSPYLALRGFGPVEIGLLIALVSAARAVVPLMLGWIADATKRPTRVLQISAALAVVCFALFPLQSGLLSFGLLSLLFGAFWNAVIPLFDSHALHHLGTQSHRYGRLRLWGSVGFIVVTSVGGFILDQAGYRWVPWLALPPMIGAFLMTLTVPPMATTADRISLRELGSIVRSRGVVAALVVATLVVMSSGAYYAFFSIWLETNHYDKSTIGLLWALGVLAEVAVFAMGQSLLTRFSIRTLFIAAAAGTAVRWMVVAWFVAHPVLLAASQLLHCLSFAVLHFAIVLTAHREFPPALQSTGQSLFSSVAYGGGGLAGSLLAGVIWAAVSARASYVTAAIIVVFATICAVLGLRGTSLDQISPRQFRNSRAP
ncbi:MAG TPA: MFS transporter [Povalibacter sp.]|uniref:MFS transporter n=1 Tax=Povalibacter sp. TaxID=1962978 RepID=UPI002D048C6B|nr:MFS transporter [Povalibacter sp.]HMN45674.1 MFS transporter [Povalibacter sp.]